MLANIEPAGHQENLSPTQCSSLPLQCPVLAELNHGQVEWLGKCHLQSPCLFGLWDNWSGKVGHHLPTFSFLFALPFHVTEGSIRLCHSAAGVGDVTLVRCSRPSWSLARLKPLQGQCRCEPAGWEQSVASALNWEAGSMPGCQLKSVSEEHSVSRCAGWELAGWWGTMLIFRPLPWYFGALGTYFTCCFCDIPR